MLFALLSTMTSASRVSAKPAAEHRRPVRKHALLFTLAGPQQGQLFPVHGTTIWVGRSPRMSVCLDDDAVSAEHAHVTRRSDRYYVVDDGSRNGTYVNDERVTGSQLLIDGDHLQFGNTILKFSMADELEERALRDLFDLTVRDPLTRKSTQLIRPKAPFGASLAPV
jgi:two-component system, cell cycle response regulator